jgi:hypothetical protein
MYGFMPRGAGRTSSIRGFTRDQLKEFYNNEDNPAKGTADITFTYGPPDGPPERRLRIRLEFYVIFMKDGEQLGWQDSIVSEKDDDY